MTDDTTQDADSLRIATARPPRERLALVIAWSREQPERVGEVAFVPYHDAPAPQILGRGPRRRTDAHPRLAWLRQRPGQNEPRGPLEAPALSRTQTLLRPSPEGLALENVGRCELALPDVPTDVGVLRVGELAVLSSQLVVYLTRRPVVMPKTQSVRAKEAHPFGRVDAQGIVGESPAAWAMRDELAFAAKRPLHVLITGATGTGKELAARALHTLGGSTRGLVARNAATIPASLMDVELFGNARDYPNSGMPARDGLVGAADGSTLFLDEIAELGEELQVHLLRVLDRGEYHRLGETQARRSKFRLVGATNRDPDALKEDLRARLTLAIHLPSLAERREDVPLIAQHLLREAADDDREIRDRFAEPTHVRVAPELITALMRHELTSNVRELHALLWRCIQKSTGRWIALAPDVASDLHAQRRPSVVVADVTEAQIRQALEDHDYVISRAARALGLKNRHALRRLMQKLGVERP